MTPRLNIIVDGAFIEVDLVGELHVVVCEVHAPLLRHVPEHEVVLQHDVAVVVDVEETAEEEIIDTLAGSIKKASSLR